MRKQSAKDWAIGLGGFDLYIHILRLSHGILDRKQIQKPEALVKCAGRDVC